MTPMRLPPNVLLFAKQQRERTFVSDIRFDPEDVQCLRDRVARSVIAASDVSTVAPEPAPNPGGLVQLNVRIPPDVKNRLADLARRRGMSLAGVIEQAINSLEKQSP